MFLLVLIGNANCNMQHLCIISISVTDESVLNSGVFVA